MANTPSPHDLVGEFIARLEKLDAGGRARLKRNAGRTLDDARNAYQVFFGVLPKQITYWSDQETFFLIATLYAVGTRRKDGRFANPQRLRQPRNLGASLRRVRQQFKGTTSSDRQLSLDKRVNALLEADREQLPFRLQQMVRLLTASEATKEAAINWSQLLHDVLRWQGSSRNVQRRWAEDYFVGSNDTGEAAPDAASELTKTNTSGE